jgi:hypothetical protein
MVSQERPILDEVASPTITARWFAEGNYVMAAWKAHPSEWQKFAAMGLIGKTMEAIEGLSHFAGQEPSFYSGVATWIGGDDAAAAKILEQIPTAHSKNLLALIQKPKIRVLTQLPWSSTVASGPIVGARQDPKFDVQNIGFDQQDLPNEPYADVHKFFDPGNPPDFYLCGMVEWHVIPPNLQELPCPTFGATTDYDLHLQTIQPWLQLFDEVIVAEQCEHSALRCLVASPVATFPKLYSFLDELPSLNNRDRDLDVFQSGSILHPYHLDKTEFVQAILRMPGVRSSLINGFVPRGEYYETLGRTKATFTYVRHPGGISSRGLEALAMGCVVLVQHDCLMRMYFTEDDGVVGYEPRTGEFEKVLSQVLAQRSAFQERARRGAELVRREFALPRAMSQCLRFLTFLAAKPRAPRRRQPTEELRSKRSVVWKGWLAGGPEIMAHIRERNLARWQERFERKPSAQLLNDMARELVLEYAARTRNTTKVDAPELLSRAFEIYREGKDRFPSALVLRFNFIRTALHYGWPLDVSEALRLAQETVAKPSAEWSVEALDDIMPWDYCNSCFNYRSYFEAVEAELKGDAPSSERMRNLIYASIHHYLGCYQNDLHHHERAVSLDPDFPYYQFSLATSLARSKNGNDLARSVVLLTRLAEDTLLFRAAFDLLKQIAPGSPDVAALEPIIAKAERECLFRESVGFDQLQPASYFSLPYLQRRYWRFRWQVLRVSEGLLGSARYATIRRCFQRLKQT